ncbi:MAG: PmbA/TldA family metallopeptidase, partial [Gemmatimonadales bacterium]
MAEWLSRAEARQLAERVLGLSQAEGCQVNLVSGASGNTRYARNGMTTGGDTVNAGVTVTARFGKRTASVTTNVLDDAGLTRAVQTSERLAHLAPEDPELMSLLPAQVHATVSAFSEATAALDAAGRAAAVQAVTGAARRAG